MSDARTPSKPGLRSRLSASLYAVGLLQLVVAAVAIVVVHQFLQRTPFEREPGRARGLLLAFGEMFDMHDVLDRAMARMTSDHMVEMAFYRLDGTRVASTEPPMPALTSAELTQLQAKSAIELPHKHGSQTAALISRDGVVIGYGLMHMRRSAEGRPGPPPGMGGPPGVGPPPGGDVPPGMPPSGARPPGMPRGPHAPPLPPLLSPSFDEPFGIAVAVFAAAIIAFLFARSLARPLARLSQAAAAFGAGDLNARTNIRRSDEIGAVARTFDEMAERVNTLLRTQREFLANVSHELRTPLARIRVALDIAAEGEVEAARESLADIALDWTDLDRMVEALLMIARLDLASDPTVPAAALSKAPLDAVAFVDRAAAAFRGTHPGRTLVVEHADDAIPLVADGGLLRRVLDNLLTNAAKYSESDAPVRLVVRADASEVAFDVIDTGVGVEAADVPHLFEPFFRTDRTRTRKTGGVGLGLSLVKRIVDAHSGRIAVTSRVGVGTTVTFAVPADHA